VAEGGARLDLRAEEHRNRRGGLRPEIGSEDAGLAARLGVALLRIGVLPQLGELQRRERRDGVAAEVVFPADLGPRRDLVGREFAGGDLGRADTADGAGGAILVAAVAQGAGNIERAPALDRVGTNVPALERTGGGAVADLEARRARPHGNAKQSV